MKKAIIDIDGVLNYYPQTWLDFLEKEKGLKFESLKDVKETLSYKQYKEYKEDYRYSIYKNDAKVRADAKLLFDLLHNKGYLIYIITARPLFKYNLLENTILWLQKNELKYDYIYCSQKKDFTIFEKFGHIDLVIEDNCDNIEKIRNINGPYNCRYFIVNNKDNMTYGDNPNMYTRVDGLYKILEVLTNDKN